ncbi:MAG TPA: hypothetical protein DCR97_08100 [Deltaproteobacteria bacterium]|nr:hypothetical protein [Deltaproteobacteria bacterium]
MIKIGSDASGRITVTFPYSQDIVAKVKTIQTRQWHPEGRYWSFQRSESVFREMLSVLAGKKLQIDPSLLGLMPEANEDNRPARNPSTSPLPTTDPLPDRVRHVLRLKHYSSRTEDTYLH